MESNFSNNRIAPQGKAPSDDAIVSPPEAASTAPTETAGISPSLARFNSCRWQQPADNGNSAFCTHREVKPYAGTAGFDSDAWCPECQYYKLRRAPKKRMPTDDYSY